MVVGDLVVGWNGEFGSGRVGERALAKDFWRRQ